ncbi:TetR/AcrR family transcriptional regulator [Photobacterium rosenbergii]|uniref:TetR/AcrR family transcriptional regulator n=1 Tax=Photobacterium rosenbergii TaxID=294936 RepID=A0A2T3NJU0_9GAMM|nr:TetR/AcrR family transcriptional regulator [Photobacterium rosenbergii]PSW15777.1 TetR/AcrR family transcriptional regulator [Photobacterium rosenbergii]
MAKAKFSTTQEALGAIFRVSIPLFAKHGFSGVSIRQVASAVGVSIATIYHHFPDKKALYLRSIEESFKDKAMELEEILKPEGTIGEQLHRFILRFTELVINDHDFELLFHRELLEGDPERLRVLADEVFREQFKNVVELAKRLAPETDPHMTAISLFGLVFFHLETASIRPFLPDGEAKHNKPELVAKNICNLLVR